MNNFDRFDICEAYYLYARDYHYGQLSKAYSVFARLKRIGFKPSPFLSFESLSDNGQDIYNELVKNDY
jgi:hypothetical protein